MEEIYLTFAEKSALLKARIFKHVKLKDQTATSLIVSGLLQRDYSEETNEYGELKWKGTYSITDKCTRFRIFKRQDFWKRIVTPVTVTVITNIVLYLLKWLLGLLR